MPAKAPPSRVLQTWGPFVNAAVRSLLFAIFDWPGRVALNSWWRSRAENDALPNSAPYSQHLVGLAFDLSVLEGDREELARALELRGFTVLRRSTHLHVQTLPAGTVERVARHFGDEAVGIG